MKRLLLLFFSILVLETIIAGDVDDYSPRYGYVSGKIIDKEDGSPVDSAIIETFSLMGAKTIEKTTSNSKGEFTLPLFGPRIICISHPKFKTDYYKYIAYPRYQKYINLTVVKKSEWEEDLK